MPMPIFLASKRRVRRQRSGNGAAVSPPPGPGPTLVSGDWDEASQLDLSFDVAVSVGSLVAGSLIVNDPFTGNQYTATSATATGSDVVVMMAVSGTSVGDELTLTATGNTGIVATVGGGAWAGVIDFPLSK